MIFDNVILDGPVQIKYQPQHGNFAVKSIGEIVLFERLWLRPDISKVIERLALVIVVS